MALVIAAISMEDLVPSKKELNICGFMPPAAASSGETVMAPDRVRRA